MHDPAPSKRSTIGEKNRRCCWSIVHVLCGELLMKHLQRGRRRYQRNSQSLILASHESEEQLSELIWDYEGHESLRITHKAVVLITNNNRIREISIRGRKINMLRGARTTTSKREKSGWDNRIGEQFRCDSRPRVYQTNIGLELV